MSRPGGPGGKTIIPIALLFAAMVLCSSMVMGQTMPEDEDDDDPPWEFIMVGGFCLFALCGLPIIGLIIGIWNYKDAEARGKKGAVWLIINILLPFLGAIIWLLVRPKEKVGQMQQVMGGKGKDKERKGKRGTGFIVVGILFLLLGPAVFLLIPTMVLDTPADLADEFPDAETGETWVLYGKIDRVDTITASGITVYLYQFTGEDGTNFSSTVDLGGNGTMFFGQLRKTGLNVPEMEISYNALLLPAGGGFLALLGLILIVVGMRKRGKSKQGTISRDAGNIDISHLMAGFPAPVHPGFPPSPTGDTPSGGPPGFPIPGQIPSATHQQSPTSVPTGGLQELPVFPPGSPGIAGKQGGLQNFGVPTVPINPPPGGAGKQDGLQNFGVPTVPINPPPGGAGKQDGLQNFGVPTAPINPPPGGAGKQGGLQELPGFQTGFPEHAPTHPPTPMPGLPRPGGGPGYPDPRTGGGSVPPSPYPQYPAQQHDLPSSPSPGAPGMPPYHPQSWTCPNCQAQIETKYGFCTSCGYRRHG